MIQTVKTIVEKKICCGCGTCTVVCPNGAIRFKYGERFNFPIIDEEKCFVCKRCLDVCPSKYILFDKISEKSKLIDTSHRLSFLAYSKKEKIRLNGASGGFVTGLLIHLLENKMIDGCIVTRCEGSNPFIAESFIHVMLTLFYRQQVQITLLFQIVP